MQFIKIFSWHGKCLSYKYKRKQAEPMVTCKAWLQLRESLGTERKTSEKVDDEGVEVVGGRQAPSPREFSRCPQ